MVSADFARNIVGIIGNVISFFLFMSPLPTFIRIFRNRDVERFQPYPYLAAVLNCALWVFYGLPFVTKDSILVVTINGFGLVLELIYLLIFFIFDKTSRGRRKILSWFACEVVLMAIIICVAMLVWPTSHQHHRSLFVGIFCDLFNVIMYSSPLVIMKQVIATKSVEYMPFYLSLANFLNGSCWTAYALIKLDIFLLISNGLGALAGLAQLILYGIYYRREKPTPEVQLSGVAVGSV